jgi:aminocarboxymuconate-semialdehyde decarboxylase
VSNSAERPVWEVSDNRTEVPVAGKMLCSEEKLSKFLTWHERANMLAGNAITLFNLGPSFKKTFQNRLSVFEKAQRGGYSHVRVEDTK